jgi:hypothetical protein
MSRFDDASINTSEGKEKIENTAFNSFRTWCRVQRREENQESFNRWVIGGRQVTGPPTWARARVGILAPLNSIAITTLSEAVETHGKTLPRTAPSVEEQNRLILALLDK